MTDPEDNTMSLPTQSDFDPDGAGMDALDAWKHFGGLTIGEAYTKFCQRPDIYQEDFMFMGDVAFSYYFPVVERYVRESQARADNDYEVDAICILAHCISGHFDEGDTRTVDHLRLRVTALVGWVLNNLSQYSPYPEERERIRAAWTKLDSRLSTSDRGG